MNTGRVRVRRILSGLLPLMALLAAVYFLALRPTGATSRRATIGTVLVEALGTGSIESRRTVDVSFEVTGRVTAIHVDQGDTVVEGQVLAVIDDTTFVADVALAEQEVALARSTLSRLEADIERARAVLQGAKDGLERVNSVAKTGAVSEEAIDIAQERHKVAEAGLSRAQAARLEGNEAILTAERRRDGARALLERTVVHSPFEGIVTRRAREVGDVAVPGAAVLELAATDTVWASVWVDETYLASLSVGLPARIVLRSEPGRSVGGIVARIGREVDRETRELLVDVSFDTLPDKLVLGQRVDLWIELGRRDDVLTIPAAVVVRVDEREGVFVAEESRARFRSLELGARGRDRVEVLTGLSSDDAVLEPTDTKKKPLEDGTRIRLAEASEKGQR